MSTFPGSESAILLAKTATAFNYKKQLRHSLNLQHITATFCRHRLTVSTFTHYYNAALTASITLQGNSGFTEGHQRTPFLTFLWEVKLPRNLPRL